MAPRLRFNEPLSWKAGRAIPVGELLKRLQSLAKELERMDQGDPPKEELAVPAKELASFNLLSHKDKGVRAWTAHCLVDILRVFAPEAPYTGQQLRDIYTLFVRSIVPSLSDTSDPYNSQHIYVLNSLSSIKSIVLLADVPSANALILDLFASCFDVLAVGGEEVGKGVEYHLTGVLTIMIEECKALPNQVIDTILAQFLHADPATKSGTSKGKKSVQVTPVTGQSTINFPLPASYKLAKNLCNTCADRMVKYVSHYFSSVIMDASSYGSGKERGKSVDSDENNDVEKGPSDDDVKQLEKAHRLLRELWRSCPAVLQNVIPQVEQELSAENEQLRSLATGAVGDLVAGIGAAGPAFLPDLNPASYPPHSLSDDFDRPRERVSPQTFAQIHATAYQNFLSRKNDKSANIRACWTTCVGRILATSAGGSGLESPAETELATDLARMLVDGDEKVRIAAIQTVNLFTLSGIVDKLGLTGGMDDSGSFMSSLSDRVKDRKPAVRSEAIRTLGKMWGAASGELARGNNKVSKLLRFAPSRLFNAYYVNDLETKHFIDQALFESLIPIGYPVMKKSAASGNEESNETFDADKIRALRMLLLLESLDEKARPVFFGLISRSKSQGPYMDAFLKRCEEYNGGVMDSNASAIRDHLNKLIDYFANSLLDPQKAREDLRKFAKQHDRRCYVLLRFCLAPESDYRKVYKSLKEFERRLVPAHASVFETLKPLVNRLSNLFINKSHIRPIIDISRSNEFDLGPAANDMLKQITTQSPVVFKTHAEELCRSLERQAPDPDADDRESGALDVLKACSSFAKRFPEGIPKDRKFHNAMVQYALYDPNPAAGKHAVSIILHSTDKKHMYAKDLLKQCVDGFEYGSSAFLTKLACMSQLMLLAADALENSTDGVVRVAIKQVLNQVRRTDSANEAEWQDEPDEECQAKIWALRILVNRLRHYEDPENIQEGYKQTYQMLTQLVSRKGELSKSKPTPKPHRARLYLEAALLLIKLCAKRGFDGMLNAATFQQLALIAQAQNYHVRLGFLTKIKKLLAQDRLPSRFYCPILLLAHEPDRRFLEDSARWLRARSTLLAASNARQPTKRPVLEQVLARLLSVLAHHPDFTLSDEDLADSMAYILFYLRCVASPQNISLIYHVAQRVKSVQDALALNEAFDDDIESSRNLYALSDLTQAVIRVYQEDKNWNMQSYAGKIQMPGLIFKGLPSHQAAQDIATKNYLPASFASRVEDLVRASLKTSKKRKMDPDAASKPAKRRLPGGRNPPGKAAKATPKKKSNGITSDGEDDDMDVDGSLESMEDGDTSARRRSGRGLSRKSYAEASESADDAEDAGDANMQEANEVEQASSAKNGIDEENAEGEGAALNAEPDADGSGKENETKRSPNDRSRAKGRKKAAEKKTNEPTRPSTRTRSTRSRA